MDGVDVLVRSAQPGDGQAIARNGLESARYYRQLLPEDFRLPDQDGVAEWLDSYLPANGESELALVAETDDQVVGYLEARVEQPMESARFQSDPDLGETRLFINYVVTAPAFWRRGVGSRLVEAAEEWGRSRGATIAICDTHIGSPVSIPFWEQRMGYRRRAVILRKPLT
jgi:GNAT superfamily N-acetyltransferase